MNYGSAKSSSSVCEGCPDDADNAACGYVSVTVPPAGPPWTMYPGATVPISWHSDGSQWRGTKTVGGILYSVQVFCGALGPLEEFQWSIIINQGLPAVYIAGVPACGCCEKGDYYAYTTAGGVPTRYEVSLN